MVSVVTKFSSLIRAGKMDDAATMVEQWPVVVSSHVTMYGGERCKLLGTVLHVSKAKKLNVASKGGEKKMKRDLAYHRLLFVRLLTITILVFCSSLSLGLFL
jgi:hypothetical protein